MATPKISEQITRIATAKSDIKTAVRGWDSTLVAADANITNVATAIKGIANLGKVTPSNLTKSDNKLTIGAGYTKGVEIPVAQVTSASDKTTVSAGYVESEMEFSSTGGTTGTATASDIRTGKTAWVNGAQILGTLQDGSVTISDSVLTSGSTPSFTLSTVAVTAGVVAAKNIPGATFTNTAKSGVSYKNISNTSAAPILISDDSLYITAGYTDNVKIDLARLVPDEADLTATTGAGYILSGHSAYDKDGKLITGTIESKAGTAGNITINPYANEMQTGVSGAGLTIPAGYYDGTTKVYISEDLYNALAAI